MSSHAVRSGTTLYVSGQIGLDPKVADPHPLTAYFLQSNSFPARSVEVQTEQALKNLGMCVLPLIDLDQAHPLVLGSVLRAGGSDYNKVLKTTILLRDMNDFPTVNVIYGKCATATLKYCTYQT